MELLHFLLSKGEGFPSPLLNNTFNNTFPVWDMLETEFRILSQYHSVSFLLTLSKQVRTVSDGTSKRASDGRLKPASSLFQRRLNPYGRHLDGVETASGRRTSAANVNLPARLYIHAPSSRKWIVKTEPLLKPKYYSVVAVPDNIQL